MRYKPVQPVRSILTILGALLAPLPSGAQQPPSVLDQYVQKALTDWNVPGIAVAAVRGDTVLFARGYGVRTIGKKDKVDEHTVFDAASLTKSFTATAAAILVDEGRLRWDDPVRRHIPEIEFPDPYLTANVTMRDLLSHRTGLQTANFVWRFTGYDRPEVLRRVRFLRTEIPFRSGMVYSNTGYMVAGEAIARAAGISWTRFVRQRLLDPLGMSDSYLWSERDTLEARRGGNVAMSHIVVDDRQIPVDNRDGAVGRDGRNVTEAAGAVLSSVSDLAKWMMLHLANGTFAGKRIVSDSAIQETHAPQVIVPTSAAFRAARQLNFFATYGMGWQVWDYKGHVMLWHSGSGNGQIAFMAILPKEKLGVVVLINSWRAPILHGGIAGRVLDHYLGLPTPIDSGAALKSDSAARRRAHDNWLRFLATRDSVPRALKPVQDYAGVYDDTLHGAITIRPGGKLLTLQIGRGEIADLERWNGDSLFVRWRNPVYREDYPTLAIFSRDPSGAISKFTMQLNRDRITAIRASSRSSSSEIQRARTGAALTRSVPPSIILRAAPLAP